MDGRLYSVTPEELQAWFIWTLCGLGVASKDVLQKAWDIADQREIINARWRQAVNDLGSD